MIIPLLKTDFKKNWTLLLIFFAVLCMYVLVMVSMYDPASASSLLTMLEMLPQELVRAMGLAKLFTDLTGYLASWLYGLLMIGFPMVYSIILGNRLVAGMVDNGSFACLLSTPNSRTRIIFTQGVYALLSVTVLFAALFAVGILGSAAMHPGLLDIAAFFRLNLVTLLVNLLVMMIVFFFSCLFNDAKRSVAFGSGFPIAFLLLNMLGDVSESLAFLKRLTVYGWYDPVDVVYGGQILGLNVLYLAATVALFAAGIMVFKNKRLPL